MSAHRPITAPEANPLGIDGFDFVEFSAPAGHAQALHDLFRSMGFTAVRRHKRHPITVHRQGDVTFVVNETPDSFAANFANRHGPCVCGFAMRFQTPAAHVRAHVLARGGTTGPGRGTALAAAVPTVEGIGGCLLYLVDRYGSRGSVFDDDYVPLAGVNQYPAGFGLTVIDHLTHNLRFGTMQTWSDYYERLFNFHELHYFDIKGVKTGLVSKAMAAPDGRVRIPLNESRDPKSQINEYLKAYHGEGIQHIACFTEDICRTVEAMRSAGVPFLDTPETYFDAIDQRIPQHGEDVPRLRANKILIDADPETKTRLLLQIFTHNCIGPIFFEIIQRKGNEGFGEGNFQALFDAIERDQVRRGVL